MERTLVLVCKTQYNNCTRTNDSYFWGIGDIIRGIYGLYRMKEQYGYEMCTDLRHHPIGKFLEHQPYSCEDQVEYLNRTNAVGIVRREHVDDTLKQEFSKNNLVYFFTNMGLEDYHGTPSADLCGYIQRILTPTPRLQELISQKRSQIPYTQFQILHYRLGDDELVRGSANTNYGRIYSHFLAHYEPNDVLLSDSKTFLEYVGSRHPVFQFKHDICHVGYHDNRENAIANTLVEFFISSQSRKIKTYTIYGWISGFMHSVHKVYQIPMEYQTNL